MARSALSRLSPVFWVAATFLVIALVADPRWSTATARVVIGLIILLTGAAIGGVVCGAIEATHDGCVDKLLAAVVASRPKPAPRERNHRAAA